VELSSRIEFSLSRKLSGYELPAISKWHNVIANLVENYNLNIIKFTMHKFDLEDGMFYSYNNKTISSNQSWSLTNISENSLLRIVAWNIYKNNKKQKLSLSSRINRFLTHSKWADKHFTSNNG
jgi:hypothetical protein